MLQSNVRNVFAISSLRRHVSLNRTVIKLTQNFDSLIQDRNVGISSQSEIMMKTKFTFRRATWEFKRNNSLHMFCQFSLDFFKIAACCTRAAVLQFSHNVSSARDHFSVNFQIKNFSCFNQLCQNRKDGVKKMMDDFLIFSTIGTFDFLLCPTIWLHVITTKTGLGGLMLLLLMDDGKVVCW